MRRVVSDEGPGRVIDVQNLRGGDGTNMAVGAAWANMTRHSNGALMRLLYTPPVDCWWEVEAWTYFTKTDAVYAYAYTQIVLTPVDVDGNGSALAIGGGMHSGVVQYQTVRASEIFKLAAGVAYIAQVQVFSSTPNMNANRTDSYSGIRSKAISR